MDLRIDSKRISYEEFVATVKADTYWWKA